MNSHECVIRYSAYRVGYIDFRLHGKKNQKKPDFICFLTGSLDWKDLCNRLRSHTVFKTVHIFSLILTISVIMELWSVPDRTFIETDRTLLSKVGLPFR